MKTQNIHIRNVPVDVLKKLDEMAKRTWRSRQALVIKILTEATQEKAEMKNKTPHNRPVDTG